MDNGAQAFVGIDIGTSFIKLIAMKTSNNNINVIGVGVARSNGMNKGMVVDINQTAEDIKAAQKDLNKKSKISIDQVVVGIPTNHLSIEELKGSLELGKDPREVDEEDLNKLISSILKENQSIENDFVGIAVEEFIVDNFDGISDPLGMMGTTLRISCLAYSIPKTIFRNIIKAVEVAGFKVRNVVLNPVAIAEVSLSPAQKEMGSILIDAGSGKTSYSIFQNNLLQMNGTIFEGGKNVTSDISKVLKISENDAESVKIDYGTLKTRQIQDSESFVIRSLDQSNEVKVQDKYLSEIIQARFEQIFTKIKNKLSSSNAFELPGGIIITGGNSALPGTEKEVSKIIGRPVNIYIPDQIGLRSQIYTVVYGMIIHTWRLSRVQRILESSLKFNKFEKFQSEIPEERKLNDKNADSDFETESGVKATSHKKKKKKTFLYSLKKLYHNLFE